MRTGVSYMGHHNPGHMEEDLADIASLGCKDVFFAVTESDLAYFPGKCSFGPRIAKEHGLRPVAILWGAINFFGGGRHSLLLLEHPEGRQVGRDGKAKPEGCYVDPLCVDFIKRQVAHFAASGFEGYFVDEPTPIDCYCPSCRAKFGELFGGDLSAADDDARQKFRARCVTDYIRDIADYCKANFPSLSTMCCVMPIDRSMWKSASEIRSLDDLGTDIYWVNDDNDVKEMIPLVNDLAALCKRSGKRHQEWLQAWIVKKGNEHRIIEQGKILVDAKPDGLYVWAYKGQIGTAEACEDPAAAWEAVKEVFRLANNS